MQIIKRINDKAIAALLIIAVTVAMAVCAFSITFGIARADGSDDLTEYQATSLDPGNPQFSDSSGSYPASPSNWSGAYLGNGNGSIVAGVVDLSPATYNTDGDDDKKGNKKYELDQYPEYADGDIPRTVFGSAEYAGTDAKALLINTPKGSETAYAYTSSDMTFAPESFYRVSAWVKTGNFATNTGATIKLTGLGTDCSFHNINTARGIDVADKDAYYGWQKYTFYVRTGMSVSHTVNLVLGIGDVANGNEEDPVAAPNPAHGYAFFDTVEAERISPEQYAHITSGFSATDRDNVFVDVTGRSMVLDLNDTEFLKNKYNDDAATEIGSFTDVELSKFDNSTGWWGNASHEDNEDGVHGGNANAFVYNAYLKNDVNADDDGKVSNVYGMTQNPWTPFGKAETKADGSAGYAPFDSSSEILAISTYSNGSFGTAALGVASPDVTIERYGYYRFGVWVKGDSVSGGNGISVGVVGECNNTGNNNVLHQRYNNLDGDASDAAHYGWKEHVIYIRGSMLSDLTVHFELWLGSPIQKSSGIAYFDNVTFKKLTYTEYSTLSGADGGNVLTLDGIASDTGISNGNLMSIGDFDELEYPLPAAEWTFGTAETAETAGFSTDKVDSENVVHGILPVDDATFNGIKNEGKLPGITSPKTFANAPLYNSLILSSSTKTAAFYRTASMTATAGTGYRIKATIAVEKVANDGYGASLVLKAGNAVVSTIEGIKDTHNEFKTFTFYVDAPVSDQTLSLEIWLGLNDRTNNTQKLSNGNVYVKSVALESWTVDENTTVSQEYAKIAEKYAADIKIPAVLTNLDYGVYSFNAPNLDYYDAYSYYLNGGYAVPYQWNLSTARSSGTVKGGLFDPDVTEIYNGFEKKDQTGNMLFIYNTLPNKATYAYANSIPLESNTYYRLDVTVKVRMSDEERASKQSVGANIKLTGTSEHTFENIKDTSTLVMPGNEDSRDYETFKTYTFFISAGADGGNIGLEVSLGGDDITSYIQGMLIVSDIKLTSINNTTFETATAEENLNEDYQKAVKLSETAADDGNDVEEPSNDLAWWVIPTVIFSACLVAAIILIVVMRLKDVIKRKKKKTFKTDYDRSDVLKKIDELSKEPEADGDADAKDDLSDEFDGESSVTENVEPTAEDETPATDAETENAETETVETEVKEKADDAQDLDD